MNHQGKKTATAFWVAAAVCALSIIISVPVLAQLSGATLSGIVKDESGGSIPNASVSIKNVATGAVRETTTNTDGLYSAPNLAPGDYEIKVSAKGFSTLVQKGITLTVGAEQALNFTLKVGQVTQTVEVTEAVPAVELTSSTISAVVDSSTVRELPLNGRDWTSLATLQPGIISIHAQASAQSTANRGNRGFGDQLTDSGHRPNENTYRVNGININDYSNGSPGSVLGVNLGVDAVQEFSVVTTNYTAEYGRTSGAVINAVTKSGTNQFHGTGYFFDRDKIFDARNFFNGGKVPPFRRIQFGASAGGAIIKDKTFIFGAYEGIRQNRSQSGSVNVLNAADIASGGPTGMTYNFCSTGVACTAPIVAPTVVPIDPLVQPFLKLWTGAKGTLGAISANGDTQKLLTSGVLVLEENYFTVKADHKVSDKDNISGSYFFDNAPQTQPDVLNNVIHEIFTRRQMASAEWNHVFNPTLANVFRLGYSRVVGLVQKPVKAINPAASDPALCAICAPTPLFSPLITGTALQSAGGLGNPSFFGHRWNSAQAYDDVFLSHGTHSLKFGLAFERMQYNVLALVRRNGSFGFGGSLLNFLTNHDTVTFPALLTDKVNVLLLDPSPTHRQEVGSRSSLIGGYGQDDWRIRPNLTLNIGLRYEMLTNPTEAADRFGTLPDLVTTTVFGFNPTINIKHLFDSNPTIRNFDPRIGFSWDPFRNGKTAVRGGFGVFDVLPLPYVYTIGSSLTLPFSLQTSASNLPPGSFPTGALALVPFTNLSSAGSRFIERSPGRSYATNWNLNVQREITSSLSAMVGYVGSHTVHLPVTYDDANQVLPTLIAGNRILYPFPTGSGTVANPNVGFIRPVIFDGTSSYEGLQSQIKWRQSHGLQAQAVYTYGKCLDDGSGAQLGDPFLNSLSSLITYAHRRARRGNCDTDITHNFVFNGIYTIPAPKFNNAADYIVGGWEVGTIVTASTGTRFTAVMGGDPLGENNSDPFDFPDRIKGCSPYTSASTYKTGSNAYLNLSCFSPPVAPASLTAVCTPFTAVAGTCQELFGNVGRNSLVGPNLINVDFSVFKNFHVRQVSEAFNIQFRAEFFNILNHTNFQAPVDNNTLFDGTGAIAGGAGQIDSTATDNRIIQLGLKIVW
jgi:hypothetical protein